MPLAQAMMIAKKSSWWCVQGAAGAETMDIGRVCEAQPSLLLHDSSMEDTPVRLLLIALLAGPFLAGNQHRCYDSHGNQQGPLQTSLTCMPAYALEPMLLYACAGSLVIWACI